MNGTGEDWKGVGRRENREKLKIRKQDEEGRKGQERHSKKEKEG